MRRLSAALLIIVMVMFPPPAVRAQTIQMVDDATLPRFEAASVKPGNLSTPRPRFSIVDEQFEQRDIPLTMAFWQAFGLRSYQLSPLPDFIEQQTFTIKARMPAHTSPANMASMIRSLVVDRFKLRYHVQPTDVDGFTLEMVQPDGQLGPMLRRSPVAYGGRTIISPNGVVECGIDRRPGQIAFRDKPIASIATFLSVLTGKPVVDATRLSGALDMELRSPILSGEADRTGRNDTTSIVRAVQDQLGLKMTATAVRVDQLAIDHIERPDAD